MNNDIDEIIKTAIDEIVNPKLEVTIQYLEVNEIEYKNGLPIVERVDFDYLEDLAAVYFKLKNQRYYLQINIEKRPTIKVNFVHIENGNKMQLISISESLSFNEMTKIFPKKQLSGWSKGDKRVNGKSQYDFSQIKYNIFNSEAYNLKKQFDVFLSDLELNADYIKELTDNTKTYISVRIFQYVSGNAGINLDVKLINRLSNLNLSVDFDINIVGNKIK